mgnify:CR=1 FL=1
MKNFIPLLILSISLAQKIIIPMDQSQNDHLKAYGIAYFSLTKNNNVEWLLNYRGGSFLIDAHQLIQTECRIRGVTFEMVDANGLVNIYSAIEQGNMDIILLEKKPKIAIYTPTNKQPWDDAVTLALTYAEVEYETLWDEEVHLGKLENYDWLHLHHEDFTGQYGKFYRSHHSAQWYKDQKRQFEEMAIKLGYSSVHEQKKGVARIIKNFVGNGGFLFAMCSATDSYDIALSAMNTDIAHQVFDGTPIDSDYQERLDFNNTIAFENFELYTDPMIYEYSTIDVPPGHKPVAKGAEEDYFTLFEFSAKWDPVPAMLTQNHVGVINGFMGQTTAFDREKIKKHVTILGEVENQNIVKYIHGNVGKGSFTFLGGHDPEDYRHMVGDPPTDLSLHRNSPGYRLILNNILFPSARKKDRKT